MAWYCSWSPSCSRYWAMYSWRFASSVPTGVGQPSASWLSLRNVLMYWANKLVEVCGKCQISWILSMSYPWVKASGALACTKCRSGRRRLRNDCNGGYTARTACQVLPQHNFCTREKAIFPGSGRVERTRTSHRVAVLCTSRGQSKETGLRIQVPWGWQDVPRGNGSSCSPRGIMRWNPGNEWTRLSPGQRWRTVSQLRCVLRRTCLGVRGGPRDLTLGYHRGMPWVDSTRTPTWFGESTQIGGWLGPTPGCAGTGHPWFVCRASGSGHGGSENRWGTRGRSIHGIRTRCDWLRCTGPRKGVCWLNVIPAPLLGEKQ